jgi:hypothetical protein
VVRVLIEQFPDLAHSALTGCLLMGGRLPTPTTGVQVVGLVPTQTGNQQGDL